MRLALFQPDIPQNTGALFRLGACLGTPIDVVEPCGFVLTDQRLRRTVMDYMTHVDWQRHSSWSAFLRERATDQRLVLLTTRATVTHTAFAFHPDDTLVLGRESAGVPDDVRADCAAAVRVPLAPGTRSLNVVTAAAIVLAEALRQTNGFSLLQEHP